MKSIRSIIIINRGEIACRIIRTCKQLGIKSIAVFSDADQDALFVKQADEAYHIPGNQPADTYINVEKIVEIIKKSDADALHPGYGFLSENADFAERCEKEGIIFIGPNPNAIRQMGSKSIAKKIMEEHQIPTIPGYNKDDQSVETLTQEALKIGFPLLLKASAGGGGKGMRIVNNENEIENAIEAAKRESKSAFGDDHLIIEKYIENARHIEFQIFGDQHGNVIHLLERECSIQRRYQKVLEESPSPVLSQAKREEMGEIACRVAKALNYDNAGTVEFVYSDKGESFYFLEVNTRLQVEHPVTEEITGLDLVKMQIDSAEGKALAVKQEEVKSSGYAMELRLYAEDASNNYMPAIGKIELFEMPCVDGLRIESGIESGSEISLFYDPMIAKIIVHGNTRDEAFRKMQYTLEHTKCLGVTTNQDILLDLVKHDEVKAGNYHTKFLETAYEFSKTSIEPYINEAFIALSAYRYAKRNANLNSTLIGWRNSFSQGQWDTFEIGEDQTKVTYKVDGKTLYYTIGETNYKVKIINIEGDKINLIINDKKDSYFILNKDLTYFIQHPNFGNLDVKYVDRFPPKKQEKVEGGYTSPMPAEIIDIRVNVGDEVKEGQTLILLSSMKMEIPVVADKDGVVEEIFVEKAQSIEADYLLLKIG